MGLIDSHGQRPRRRSVLEDIFIWGIPKDSIINRRVVQILGDTGDPCRESVDVLSLRG
jgi:hypothetical protein